MDTGILHTHVFITSLFLVAMLITVITSLGSKEKPTPKWLRLSHMILGSLMLLTGIYLMVKSPNGMEPYILVKLVLVLVATPLGIIGGRKKNMAMTGLAFLLVVGVMALAYAKPDALRSIPSDVESVEELVENMEKRKESGEMTQAEKDAEAVKIGKSLYYKRLCNSCHGDDGSAGFQKSKDLGQSTLNDAEIADIIVNGKNLMPANEGLNDSEVEYLTAFVKSLRK